jgi:hypothetical protein
LGVGSDGGGGVLGVELFLRQSGICNEEEQDLHRKGQTLTIKAIPRKV